jgi:NAD(P)-dependent dehydrogenase (short-subunit alcohol dehydrogenase family)
VYQADGWQAALENRSKNIRVNCVSPGWLWTDLVSGGLEASQVPEPLRAFWEGVEDRQGRKAYAEEIGDSVVMLCSPKLSLVNGHNLMCDKSVISAPRSTQMLTLDSGFCIYEGSFDFSGTAG